MQNGGWARVKIFVKIILNIILIVAVAFVITIVSPNAIYYLASAVPPVRDPYIIWLAFYWFASLVEIFLWFLRPFTQTYFFYNPETIGKNMLSAPFAYTLTDMFIWIIVLSLLVYADHTKKL